MKLEDRIAFTHKRINRLKSYNLDKMSLGEKAEVLQEIFHLENLIEDLVPMYIKTFKFLKGYGLDFSDEREYHKCDYLWSFIYHARMAFDDKNECIDECYSDPLTRKSMKNLLEKDKARLKYLTEQLG